MKDWGIHYGVLHDKIAFQLKAQDLPMPPRLCDRWEKQREAINILRLANLLPENAADRCFARLHKRIEKAVNKKYGTTKKP